MIILSDDFKKYIDYISFLHDLSNDAGIGNQSELIEMLKNDAKKLIAKEVIHSNQIAKAEVAVIGDFSSGKSSFINSIIGKNLCPVEASPTTSSITAFYYSDEVKILTNGDEISQSEYENLVKHNDPNTKSKAYDIKYFYPFESFRNVVLYDTPGFSNPGNKNGDTKLTMEKAKVVDVLLVVIDINTGSTGHELEKNF
ncbi:dynamin family protein [Campylobacter sp.]|uniref:dynamin family protein n=1 Tax=Campylobacter sp. TaxID=205 RepID=UPI00258B112F|nr:dynamin family protein [Campylobacter sp.]MCI6641546.1 dynamin family protein [Campylobacter sp.]